MTDNKDQNVLSKVPGEKFGPVTLVIQNGKVIQIEKNEKFRLV
jgi:hypothetical protein